MAEKRIVKSVRRKIVSDLEDILEERATYREIADYWKEDAELSFASWIIHQVLMKCQPWVMGSRKKMVPPDVLKDYITNVLDGVQRTISREEEGV